MYINGVLTRGIDISTHSQKVILVHWMLLFVDFPNVMISLLCHQDVNIGTHPLEKLLK